MTSVTRPTRRTAGSIEHDPRWAAVVRRDPRADGSFFYSVATTRVYCRPSCPSRRANPKNVAFHATAADAALAGFRPCARCRPDGPTLHQLHAARIADACRALETAEHLPTLAVLAARAGLSQYHFHRLFKSVTGVTPRAYAAAHRARRVQTGLADRSKTVTDAIYDAGFASGGRFYETSAARLGMTPTIYRAGGDGTMMHFAVAECSLGSVLVAQTAKGVSAILLGDDPDALVRQLQDRFPRATIAGSVKSFEKTVAKVIALIEAPATDPRLPLDVRGTAFQQRVWQALRRIPPGSTASYAAIAESVGMPNGSRAVARACAANPLAVAIPCHRVVRTDGSLSGYRWGVERKRQLLEREKGDRPITRSPSGQQRQPEHQAQRADQPPVQVLANPAGKRNAHDRSTVTPSDATIQTAASTAASPGCRCRSRRQRQ